MNNHKLKRRRFDFLTSEGSDQYLIFLKEHVYKTNPTMLSIAKCEELVTLEGPMFKIVVCNDIENPHQNIVACCTVNNAPILVWDDKIYTIAIDGNTTALKVSGDFMVPFRMSGNKQGVSELWFKLCNKWAETHVLTLIVHEILEPVVEDDLIIDD